MQKKYTKKQIVEAIKHWESLLKRIDESKNALLSELFAAFNTNDLLKSFNGRLLIQRFNMNGKLSIGILEELVDKWE